MAPADRNARGDVVDAALRVLDEQGLPGLSMRRIAEVLNVQVGALYWHFPNKQSLLAAVSEHVVTLPARDDTDDLTSIATTLHMRLLAHRDGAELVSSSLALGLLELPSRGLLIDAAQDAGLATSSATVAADTIVHFVIGTTFHEQQRIHAAVVGATDAAVDLDPERLGDRRDSFADGLAMVIAGVRSAARVD